MRPIRADLEELVPFIKAVIAAIRPAKTPADPTPPDRGVMPPQPYREGDVELQRERHIESATPTCWCGLEDCHLPLPHQRRG